MAKIYSAPKEIKLPEIDFSNFNRKEYDKETERYENELKAFLLENSNTKNVGEIISFPVADGSARYMVASMKPLQLIHLAIDDAWEFEYAHKLNAKDVQQKIDQRNAIEKMFGRK